MKTLYILLLTSSLFSEELILHHKISEECYEAIEKATEKHMEFVKGDISLTEDLNYKIKAERICGFSL